MFLPYAQEYESKRFPWVTTSLLFANLLVFIRTSQGNIDDIAMTWGFTPAHPHLLTVFSSMFIHEGLFHFIGNMYVLWLFGGSVEGVCGPWLFLALYIVSHLVGLGIHVLTVMKSVSTIPMIGASIGISGVLGLYVAFFPYAKIRAWVGGLGSFGVVSYRSWYLIGLWFAFQLLMASFALKHNLSIGYWGHVGGFLFGLTAGYVLEKYYIKREALLVPHEKAYEHEENYLKVQDRKTEQFLKQEDISKAVLESGVEDSLHKEGLSAGVKKYKKLESLPEGGVLPPADQKKVADELYHQKDFLNALQAYLAFLNHYPNHNLVPEISCRVGSILSDFEGDYLPAMHYLTAGISSKTISSDIRVETQQELDKIRLKIKNLENGFDPQSHTGQYSIFLLYLDKVEIDFRELHKDFSEIGVIGEINLGQKLCFDADEEENIKDGLLLDHLSHEEAKIAKQKLIEKGIDVVILPKGDYWGYPINELIKGQIKQDVFIMAGEDGKEFKISKENILHSAFAEFYFEDFGPIKDDKSETVDLSEFRSKEEVVASIAMDVDYNKPNFQVNNIGMNSVLDIFTKDLVHYRIGSRKFFYQDTSKEKLASKDHFGRFVEDFIRVVGDEKVDYNTKLYSANNTFSGLTYKNVQEFENRSFFYAMFKYYYPEK